MQLRRFQRQRVLPNFCVIGPAKSGTSDLAVTLMSHPNILCPLVKECGGDDPRTWARYYPTTGAVRRHARRHGIALSPLVAPFLCRIDYATILSEIQPNLRVIINLRDPVELAYSEWKWTILHTSGEIAKMLPYLANFDVYVEMSLKTFPECLYPFTALRNGIYWNAVAHWLGCFGERNVSVCDIAEYFTDRDAYLMRLERFVGLPHIQIPAGLPIANRNPVALPGPTAEAKARLREFFQPYNCRLWQVLGRSFPW
jgi:hypothetical protein